VIRSGAGASWPELTVWAWAENGDWRAITVAVPEVIKSPLDEEGIPIHLPAQPLVGLVAEGVESIRSGLQSEPKGMRAVQGRRGGILRDFDRSRSLRKVRLYRYDREGGAVLRLAGGGHALPRAH
jgi:hypothetical protein